MTRSDRTVTFTQNNQTQTFQSNSDDHNVNYTLSSQLTNSTRLKFSGSNLRRYNVNGSTLPAKEANGTSTANPTLFPNPFHTNEVNDSYVGELAWVVTPRFFVNTNAGFLPTTRSR